MTTKILLFCCKRGRPRDVPLLREGARAAGYRFVLALVPFAYPMILIAALLRAFGVEVRVIISDRFPGDALLARCFGADAARMLWNYADEFPACLSTLPEKRVCFFEDRSQPVALFRFAPQPVVRSRIAEPRREVVFIGDVNLSCKLPQGLGWWEEKLQAMMQAEGYGFYLGATYSALLSEHLTSDAQKRQAKVLTKNLLRLWIIQAARRGFGERIVLVGSNWRRFDLDSIPSMYSLGARLSIYEQAAVHLDCGSKSGDAALYPRSSELISYAGAPLQVVCADSLQVYGELAREIVFADEAELLALLAHRLQEPAESREVRSERARAHLVQHRLTMADSLNQLFDARPLREAPAR